MRTGRPLKFESVKELEDKIQAYFDSCFEYQWFDEMARDENGNKLFNEKVHSYTLPTKKRVQIRPITITGLAVALNTSRQTLINYEERDDFFDTIKGAKDFIENYVEEGMLKGDINPTAGIFNLKNNFEWKDEQVIDNNSSQLDEARKDLNKLIDYVKAGSSKDTTTRTTDNAISVESVSDKQQASQ